MQSIKRKERSDKKIRIYPYLKQSTHEKLELLRQAVNLNKTVSIHDIAEELLDVCMNMPEFVNWIQNKYKVPGDHPLRIVPIMENGKQRFVRLFDASNKG